MRVRDVPFILWACASVFAYGTLALGLIFFIGLGLIEEMILTLWGPTVGWMVIGALAWEWRTGTMAWTKRLAVVAVALVFWGFWPLRVWQREHDVVGNTLRKLDTSDMAAVGAFLAAHPNDKSKRVEELRQSWVLMEEREWVFLQGGDCEELARYERDFPDGKHAAQLPKFRDDCAWRKGHTYSDGDHLGEAKQLRDYLQAWPSGRHRDEAVRRLEEVEWFYAMERAGNAPEQVKALRAYLTAHPAGLHAGEGKRLLAALGGR